MEEMRFSELIPSEDRTVVGDLDEKLPSDAFD
jgi:hypothetical protein